MSLSLSGTGLFMNNGLFLTFAILMFALPVQSMIMTLMKTHPFVRSCHIAACTFRSFSSSSRFTGTKSDVNVKHILQFDGGSRGNPGRGGSSAVLFAMSTDGSTQEVWRK